jgi:hypothetical protein
MEFLCDDCKKKHDEIEHLRNLTCNECKKKFVKIDEYQKHIKETHYRCDCKRKYVTASISNFNKHMRNVHEKNHKILCIVCGKYYPTNYLKYHVCVKNKISKITKNKISKIKK